jgi:hypothetical protein
MNFGRLYTESWLRSASASRTIFVVAWTTCSGKRVDMWCRYFSISRNVNDKRINFISLQRSLLIVKNVVCFVACLITKIMKYWEFNKSFSAWEPLGVLQIDTRFRTQRLYSVCLWNVNGIESRDACQPHKILFNFVAWNYEDTLSELLITSYFVLLRPETLSVILMENRASG